MIHAVIMAGGQGERFWPWSRLRTPKQLRNIVGSRTLLEQTVARLKPLVPDSRLWVVTNIHQAVVIRKLLPQIKARQILIEPLGRNTAPAITLAAYVIGRQDPAALMAVLPADHIISPRSQFIRTLKACLRVAARKDDYLITIGITPRGPQPAYGYIQKGKLVCQQREYRFHRVKRFAEKPDVATARKFIRSKSYSWNSGIFIWTARAVIEAVNLHLPGVGEKLAPVVGLSDKKRGPFLDRTYPRLPSISIDNGVMEKHDKVLVTAATFRWDDVGSWESLINHYPRDIHNNCKKGQVVTLGATNCIAVSTKPLLGLVGVSDLIVVGTEDAVLICSRKKSQEIRGLVRRLQKKKEWRRYV